MIISKSSRWLEGAGLSQKSAESIIVYRIKKELLVFVYSFSFVFDVLEEKKEKIVLTFFYFMHITPVSIFLFFSRVLNF